MNLGGTALDQMARNQEKIKGMFDHKARQSFQRRRPSTIVGQKKEKPGMHKKFDSLWTGPYRIVSEAGLNSFNLATLEGEATVTC
jgi:hypothetical protein